MLRSRPVDVRLQEKVDKSGPVHPALGTPCWLWTATKSRTGYANISVGRKTSLAHRVSFELYRGKIPDGLELDHLCRVRHCVNPAHLEPVTCKVNLLRGVSFSAVNAVKTHCVHGHELSAENLAPYVEKRKHRRCRECERVHWRKCNDRNKARRAAAKAGAA